MLHGQKTILKPRDMVFRPMNVAHPGVCDTIKNAFTQHGPPARRRLGRLLGAAGSEPPSHEFTKLVEVGMFQKPIHNLEIELTRRSPHFRGF